MSRWPHGRVTNSTGSQQQKNCESRHGSATVMMRDPVTIRAVRINDDLYVRSINGRVTSWFRGAQERKEGRIWAGSVEKEVAFVKEPDPGINDQIDAAYRAKYRHWASSLISDVTCPEARATTTRLVPR